MKSAVKKTQVIWSKIIAFNLPHLYLAPPLWWPRWNFAEIFGVRKLRYLGLVFMILDLAVLLE